MSYIYLQEQGEESSAACYSDIQFALSKSKNTQASIIAATARRNFAKIPNLGRPGNLMESLGEDQLTFWQEDFLPRHLMGKGAGSAEHVRDFGKSMRELLEKYGLALFLPKTHHCFALEDLSCPRRFGLDGVLCKMVLGAGCRCAP